MSGVDEGMDGVSECGVPYCNGHNDILSVGIHRITSREGIVHHAGPDAFGSDEFSSWGTDEITIYDEAWRNVRWPS